MRRFGLAESKLHAGIRPCAYLTGAPCRRASGLITLLSLRPSTGDFFASVAHLLDLARACGDD